MSYPLADFAVDCHAHVFDTRRFPLNNPADARKVPWKSPQSWFGFEAPQETPFNAD